MRFSLASLVRYKCLAVAVFVVFVVAVVAVAPFWSHLSSGQLVFGVVIVIAIASHAFRSLSRIAHRGGANHVALLDGHLAPNDGLLPEQSRLVVAGVRVFANVRPRPELQESAQSRVQTCAAGELLIACVVRCCSFCLFTFCFPVFPFSRFPVSSFAFV